MTEEKWKHEIIRSKVQLREWLCYEKKKYKKRTLLGCITEDDMIWRYQKRLRITEYHRNCCHNFLFALNRVLLYRMEFKYGMKVRINSCGRGLKIMHMGSILTNGDIGTDCSIHINVSVVAGGTNDAIPTIGDRVVLGVGAVVVGSAQIGNDCAVGANAVVNKKFIEENVTLAGVPAKIISNHGSGEWRKAKPM